MPRQLKYITKEEREFENNLRLYAAQRGIYFTTMDGLVLCKDGRAAALQEMAKDFLRDVPSLKPHTPLFVWSYTKLDEPTKALLNQKINELKTKLGPLDTPLMEDMKKIEEAENKIRGMQTAQTWIGLLALIAAVPYLIRRHGCVNRIKKQCPVVLKEGWFFRLKTYKKAIHGESAFKA